MINLTNLELNNFFSHVDSSIPLKDYKGLILIEGKNAEGHYSSNGSGKSTILEGIVYALFGDTLRGVAVNDIINRNYKKNAHVSLEFLRDGISHKIDRYRKHDTMGDSLVFHKGEEDISKRVNKETQKSIEDTLNISYKILVSTMLLGEGLSSKFTQLSDPEKKSLIESTLNLQYDVSDIRTKANAELSKLKLEKSNLEGRLSTLKELSAMDVDEAKETLSELGAEEAKLLEEYEVLKRSIEEMQANREPLESRIALLTETLNKYNLYEVQLQKLEMSRRELIDELDRIGKSEVPLCSVCHQPLTSHDAIESFNSTYREKISKIDQEILSIQSSIAALPDKSILSSKYEELTNQLKSMHQLINDANADIQDINMKYRVVYSRKESIAESLTRYEMATDDIYKLESEEKALSKSIAKYDYFYRLFSPTGIIVNILSDAISYINSRLSTYSEVLLEKDYKINFVKGKISLVDSTGASYQSLSNGEKRRLDIALQFSLHDYCMKYCNVAVDTLFIDEIMDTLDDVGIENIITVLRLKLDYCQLSRIFVISHNSALKSYFDTVITVVKDFDGNSKIQ